MRRFEVESIGEEEEEEEEEGIPHLCIRGRVTRTANEVLNLGLRVFLRSDGHGRLS